jgi:hypothetical protein
MQKLVAVEEAKALMNEAKDWGVWRWLMAKKRVRTAADKAVDALGDLEKKVKASWNDDMKKAYRELEARASLDSNPAGRGAKHRREKEREEAKNVDPEIKLAVQRVKEADDEAYGARMDAEKTFDEAERLMSAGMAREGAVKAIESWELREKAIRKAEALARRK